MTLGYDVYVNDILPSKALLPGARPGDGPASWSPVASTLVYGESDALLVDPPFAREQIDRIGDWIARSGKRLAQIYVTHSHGDHWFGTADLVARFPGANVFATTKTVERMHAEARPQGRALYDSLFPGQIPERLLIAEPIPAGGLTLEGHEVTAVEVGHTDGDDTTVLHVPSLGLVVAGDVAYNGVHQFVGFAHGDGFAQWQRAIEAVRALAPRVVVASHKKPGLADDPRILDETAEYLRTAEQLYRRGVAVPEFVDTLLSTYSDRLNPPTVRLSAALLIG